MLTARRLSALLLVGGLLACSRSREKPGAAARPIASGDAVWFEDGIGPEQTETERELLLAGFTTVFLPAVRLAGGGGQVTATELPPPPKPFEKTPVFLAVVGGAELASATADPGSADALAQTVGKSLQTSLKSRALYASTVAGVHMDIPFAPASAEAYGAFLGSLRRKIPAEYLLTFSLRFTPGEADRARLAPALAAADGFVAFVFGETAAASPVAADELGKPWWAAYSSAARGVWRDSSGRELGPLGEKYLMQLSDDPRVDVKNDLTFREEAASAFLLSPQQPVKAAGTAFSAGDRLFFRQPSLPEMLYRFGADRAGRRRLRGRMLVLPGTSERERLVTLGALADVILGHSLDPDLRVSLSGARTPAVVVSAHNATHHASVISRTQNWVEVDLPGGGIRDVLPGGFGRYEEYDGEGRSVTPGRATRVRFFETLVGPLERIDAAKIILYKPAPANCCRYRFSVASAAGPELKGDWVAPTPAPTPVAQRKHKTR
jgi:hypothetical protein